MGNDGSLSSGGVLARKSPHMSIARAVSLRDRLGDLHVVEEAVGDVGGIHVLVGPHVMVEAVQGADEVGAIAHLRDAQFVW